MLPTVAVAAIVSTLALVTFLPQGADAPSCHTEGTLVRLPKLREASGISASRRVPGRLWAHIDSRQPVLFALDTRGAVTGRLAVPGATVEDWEAIAVGRCPAGSCVFIGDIGDNDARRTNMTIYRFAEPGNRLDAPSSVDVFHAAYPNGPRDAETLLVTPEGRLYVVTKGSTSSIALYAFPRELRSGGTMMLERVGKPVISRKADERDRITDGSVSPDGKWVVLRTHAFLTFFRGADFFSGQWRDVTRLDLRPLGEPQGEGVTFGEGGAMFLVGEGGGKGRPGTFARVSCK